MDPYDFAIATGITKPSLFRESAERYWFAAEPDPRIATGRDHNIRCGCSLCSWPPNLLAVIGNGFCGQCRRALDDHGPGLKCAVAA